MLQVSDSAAAVLQQARSAQELPETYGVRVSGQTNGDMLEVSLAFAEEPLPDDEVMEQAGTQVFVAPEVAEPLTAAVLEVEDTPEGQRLAIRPQ